MSVNLRRVGLVAAREYKTAITSRGFLIGLIKVRPIHAQLVAAMLCHEHSAT